LKIYNRVPFKEVAYDFGRLSHYLADLNDPLLLREDDSREPQYQLDFAQYLERNADQFPWTFDGHEDPLLQKDRVPEYLHRIASETARSYPLLGESYFPNGSLVSSDTFDPRSLPFGIASLSYTHSIQDTVRIWFYVWKKSHGDTSYTPFHSKSKKGVPDEPKARTH
jgi:hypothetical protein